MDQQERYLNERSNYEMNFQIKWEAFKLDAIDRMRDCFDSEGDVCNLISTLDLEWDKTESLENWQINEIIKGAIK